jgi:hypothetical protein
MLRGTFPFVTSSYRVLLPLAVLAAGLVAWMAVPLAGAQEDDAPVVTFQNPKPGDVFREPAFGLQMCFEKPVNILDLDKGGDFNFSLKPPEDFPLGLRIVFQPDGYGLTVYPNNNDADPAEGEWTLSYRLTAPDTLTPTEGELVYTVDPDGEPFPQVTPPPCAENGFTSTPGSGGTPPPIVITASGTAGPSASAEPGLDDDDDGPDILLLALLTIGAAGGVGLLALIGYFVRRGVGFDPHRPGPGDDDTHH